MLIYDLANHAFVYDNLINLLGGLLEAPREML
jgi:hypothetical protein